ncbi:MAG: hypothetical protein JWN76_3433 [Chitinophagaceae bacterium]|nr:hypothetical protein [Chitinophagaceae bacterium]
MNNRRAFEIAFVGLKPGAHEFIYQINDQFFLDYGEQDFKNCNAAVKLELDRQNGFMILKFDVGGSTEVVCDRCGNMLPLQLWDEFKIMVKMVEEPELMNQQEDDPDVYYISKTESHLFVGDWIYEFINLSIPMQKMCAENEVGGPQCNKEVLEKLKNMEENVKKAGNPVWKGLDQFKNLE